MNMDLNILNSMKEAKEKEINRRQQNERQRLSNLNQQSQVPSVKVPDYLNKM